MENSLDNQKEGEAVSLESTNTASDGSTPASGGAIGTPAGGESKTPPSKVQKSLRTRLGELPSHFNIYLLLFVFVIVIAIIITVVAIQKNQQANNPKPIASQTLSQDALKQLNGSDTTVGDPKQILSIESNTEFAGTVLVRGGLDVAGTIKVGGALSLPGITVSGTSSFDQVQLNSLNVSGNAAIQGQLTVQKTLTVTGGATFGGIISAPQLNVQTLQLSNDLQLNRHIDAGGATPGKTDGPALGSGGTSSVSGTDTAGTVTINTGGGPADGCFITVNFTQKFNAIPHVVISPTSRDDATAPALAYYVTKTTSSFSICATNPQAAKTYIFDFVAID